MLNIDETCITNLERDELGTWYGQANYDGTTVDCSWDADTQEEHADERKFAVLNVLDNLRVCTLRDRIAEGADLGLTDGDVIHAIRAAERIGDDDIEGILGHAWCRGLLTDKGLTTDEVATVDLLVAPAEILRVAGEIMRPENAGRFFGSDPEAVQVAGRRVA